MKKIIKKKLDEISNNWVDINRMKNDNILNIKE